ncbi:MAG: hypothetical protein ACQEXC_07555 [Pseudomonadota bacterium]
MTLLPELHGVALLTWPTPSAEGLARGLALPKRPHSSLMPRTRDVSYRLSVVVGGLESRLGVSSEGTAGNSITHIFKLAITPLETAQLAGEERTKVLNTG